MSERSYEELSALMDGETSELELRRTLKSLPDDPELVQKWRRYHMTRAVIQGELRDSRATQFASLDLTRAIAAQLENEPSHDVENMTSAQKSSWRDKIFKPLSNIAVAASVSAVVVLSWQNINSSQPSAVVDVTAPSASANLAAATVVPGHSNSNQRGYVTVADSQMPLQQQLVTQPEIIRMPSYQNRRLNQYLMSHSGNAALNTASGAMSYARVVHIEP